ncbi:SPARC- modular calcium-binding protein 2 [Apophysomyces sp. BC1021]|nr:SPARC- modular calcium-binding protein 2 [Apophysomyces sp. BC1021]
MIFSSWHEYVFKTNCAIMLALLWFHHTVNTFNLVWVRAFLDLKLVALAEWLIIGICVHNMWNHSKHVILPLLPKFTVSPTVTVEKQRSIPSQPATTTAPTTNVPSAVANKKTEEPLLGTPINGIKQTSPSVMPPIVPASNLTTIASKQNEKQMKFDPQSALQTLVQKTKQAAILPGLKAPPPLQYVPCVPPPRKPVKRQDKTLWQLWRTPDVVDHFRQEQASAATLSKIYYDNLRTWLGTKILKPLVVVADKLDQQLAQVGSNVVECSPNIMAIMMMQFQSSMGQEDIEPVKVQEYINVPGHESAIGKQYVLNRVKELASSNRLAAFRYMPLEAGMPSDAEIILHLLTTYIESRLPSSIPPLIEILVGPHGISAFLFASDAPVSIDHLELISVKCLSLFLVKSVDLDTWIPNQVESMIKWGNERANKYWEANLQDRKPVESNMEMWIRGKYEQKRWAMKGPIPDPSTLGGEEVQTPAKPVSTPPAQQAAPPAAPKTKQSELSNLDAFFGSSSSGTQPSTASKLQGEDFFFSSSTPTTTTNSTPAPKVEKPQQDDFKSSILSLYSQTPSNPSMQTHIAGGYANNMTNYQNQLSGLTMGMPPSGVIPQAPPGQANMYQNVWNSFGNNPVANGGGFAPQPQQPQQPANSLPQGSQFFAMNSQPVEKKPAYDAFADLLK